MPMIEPEPSSRQQLVAGAADMIRRRGLNATSIREVAKYAGTPLGSTYHYFPGGKHQLAAEAIRFAGDTVGSMLAAKLRTGPVDGLRAFFALWRDILTGTDFRAGCPVLAVSVEAPAAGDEHSVLAVAADVFMRWQAQLTESLRHHGADPARATSLATLIVAASEGAVAMCRAQRSTSALDQVAAELTSLVSALINC
jgi:AcrR family transcriptional regulator